MYLAILTLIAMRLARVDHSVAHVLVESNGRSRSGRHPTRHVQESYITCTSGERPAFFFLPGGSLATFAKRGYAPVFAILSLC